MAMMISKFHRLIQNKITWWIVLVVIIFSFVIWGSQAGKSGGSGSNPTAVGQLGGQPVEGQEYNLAKNATLLSLTLTYGREISVTPEVDAYLRKAAWQRIAALREAAKLGVDSSDDEVASMQQQLPIFRTKEGQFNLQAYQQFVSQFLPRMGFSKHGFDEFIRQEIILQKAGSVVTRLMLVSPYDARRTFQALQDQFVVEYALLEPSLVEKSVKAGRDEAKALFDRDPTAYRIPEMVKVRYLRLPYSNFTAKVQVKEDEILKYYNDHLDEFALPSTQKVAQAGATNDEFSTAATTYKTREQAQPEIVTKLKEIGAADIARSNAIEVVTALQGGPGGKPLSFEEASAKFGLTIATTAPFSELDEVPHLAVGTSFNRAAFALDRNEGTNISEPVEGVDAWYILAFQDRMAERIPTFEEALEKVLPDARRQAVNDALTALAKKTRDAMDVAAKGGTSVTEAAQKLGVKLKTTEPFNAAGGDEQKVQDFDTLIRGVLPHNAGEVTDLLPTREGLIVAYVKERRPAAASTFDSIRPQIANTIRRQQGRMLFEGWQEYLLKRDNFDDLLKKATTEDNT